MRFDCLISQVMGWSWDRWSSAGLVHNVKVDSELKSVTLTGMIAMLKWCEDNLGCLLVREQNLEPISVQWSNHGSCSDLLQPMLQQQADVCLEKEEW